MQTISAAIIVKNAANHIKSCLESITWVDEIIIIDSGSTDGTQEICRNFSPKVKLSEMDWPGFGIQKNRALALTSSQWILAIDADEVVTPELQKEILQAINANSNYTAFSIPRLTYFLGRAIKHCFNPEGDRVSRLIKKGWGEFSADEVHEKLVVQGKEGALHHFLIHTPYKNCAELLEKANLYSSLGVTKLLAKNTKPGIMKTFGHSIWTFVRLYFLKCGFLDGWPGFLIAFSGAEGVFYRYAKLLEKEYYQENAKVH